MLKRLYKWWTGNEYHTHVWGKWQTTSSANFQVRTCEGCGKERHRCIPLEW